MCSKTKTDYNDTMKSIQTGEQSFRKLIERGSVYVDKTRYIRMLLDWEDTFYFAARPRRFGKSLFCSTLEEFFKGNKELFEGLYIYDKHDFEPYPVMHFNFANISSVTYERFLNSFIKAIVSEAAENGVDIKPCDDPAELFQKALAGIYEKTGKHVVIIIDEYDNNITSNLNNWELAEKIRRDISDFYKRIKNNSQYIHFFFLTGVVRLSHISIFSEMNNLTDLSMSKDFAGAFGYTDEELDEYFGEGIDEYLEANPGKYESRKSFRI